MTAPISELKPYALIIPVGGKFSDSHDVFKYNRTDFHECKLMYKPDYFFDQWNDDSNQLVDFIRNNPDQTSSFHWDQLFTLDIDERIQMQKQFFEMVSTRTTNQAEIQVFQTQGKNQLVERIRKYRASTEVKPCLISCQLRLKNQERNFIWLIIKRSPSRIPSLIPSQQYKELFYFLNHLYSSENVHSSIRLSFQFQSLTIKNNFTIIPNEKKIQGSMEIIPSPISKEIYPAQELVGENIFKIISERIPNFKDQYEKFEFYLLLPSRKSLRTQSISRMKLILSEIERGYLSQGQQDITSLTYLVNQYDKANFQKNVLDKAIHPENKKTMYLIIQDECHWGMKLNSQSDKYFVNHDILLDENQSSNIYILHVSATPYNIEAIQDFRRKNIIRWDDVVKDLQPSNYQGRIQLIQQNKLQCQSLKSKICMEKFQKYYSSFGYLSANENDGRISLPELSIVSEYLITLHSILTSNKYLTEELKEFITDETLQILTGLCQENNCLTVLRMNNVETGQYLRQWMKQLLEIYNQSDLFDIIVDTEKEEDYLYDQLSNTSKEKYRIYLKKTGKLTKQEKEDFCYDDLKYFSLLLIVIEKGRMGDTFPSSTFKYFDLRPRYQWETRRYTYYCSLLQDVGRAFGYGERPIVFMGDEIFNLLNKNELKPHETLDKNESIEEQTTVSESDYSKNMYLDLDKFWRLNKDHPFGPAAEQSKSIAHKNVADRRFLLSAHPQIGKTASFLWAVHLFIQHFNQSKYKLSNKYQNEYDELLYQFINQDSNELHHKLIKDKDTQNQWNRFHENARHIYEKWRNEPDEIVPVEKSIEIIQDFIEDIKNEEIIIIDMGCGRAQLAQHFKSNKKIKVINIDHQRHSSVPPYIDVLVMDMNKVMLKNIGNKLANFVVFSLSLWGNEENLTSYIDVAADLLELNGSMILIDAKQNKINNKDLEEIVISILDKTQKLSHQKSSERPNSRFFCILATRQKKRKF